MAKQVMKKKKREIEKTKRYGKFEVQSYYFVDFFFFLTLYLNEKVITSWAFCKQQRVHHVTIMRHKHYYITFLRIHLDQQLYLINTANLGRYTALPGYTFTGK